VNPSLILHLEKGDDTNGKKSAEGSDLASTSGRGRSRLLRSRRLRLAGSGLGWRLGLDRRLRLRLGRGLGLGLSRRLRLGLTGWLHGGGDGAGAVGDGERSGLGDGVSGVSDGDLGGLRAVGRIAGDDGGGPVLPAVRRGRVGRGRHGVVGGLLRGRVVGGRLGRRRGVDSGRLGRRRRVDGRSLGRGVVGIRRRRWVVCVRRRRGRRIVRGSWVDGGGLLRRRVVRGRRIAVLAGDGSADERGEDDGAHVGYCIKRDLGEYWYISKTTIWLRSEGCPDSWKTESDM
jgi:hypothetical protein